MKKFFVVLALIPVGLAAAGDGAKSRWRSLSTGNLFEVTDFGDRLSIRFLAAEVVEDQTTEKADMTVSMNGPKQQLRPGRWLLQKRGDGKYAGTANSEIACTYWRQWYMEWRTNACKFSDAVELSINGNTITGSTNGAPANGATFDCAKCRWSKTERSAFEWVVESADDAAQKASSGPAGPSAAPAATAVAATEGHGVFGIESTPAGADVYVNGDFVGTTPIPEHRLATGRHQVELKKKGYAVWTRNLSVSAGARATVAAELEP